MNTLPAREQRNLERRMYRRAAQQGQMLVKSRRTGERGPYVLVDDTMGNRVGRRGGQAAVSEFADSYRMTLAEVERELTEM